jgi:uncharacterized protein DUF4235
MTKVLYKPVGMLVSVLGGVLAGAIFKRVWKVAFSEDDAPKAADADRLLSTAVNFGARPPAFSPAHPPHPRPLPLTQRPDSGAALGCPLLSPQPGSFTKLRKKSSTCRIASVKRSRLTGLVMYALACNW